MLKIPVISPITAYGNDGFALTHKDDVVKIDSSIKKTSTSGVKAKQNGTTAGTEKAGAGSASSVNVSLSSQLQSLSVQVSGSNVFDSNKVDEIKAAIAGGQFQVDTEKVADGLINTVRDMIQKPKV
jgi:negative regulator of flagellin synthesis FlgM